jgi:hypothetical protein
MSSKAKKNQESTTSDESPEQEYYPKYILESAGAVTITITINGNDNNVRVLSGQAPPPPKPGGH